MDYLTDLNEAQRAAVTHTGAPLLIVAGAGTGKTTVIARRIAHLIGEKLAKPEEILAVTFTEKAAGEMEERVDALLPYGYIDLWISTFHSFCEKILRSHGLDIGLPNEFKILTQTDAWLLVRERLNSFNLDYYRPLGNPTRFIHALLQHFSRAKDEMISPDEYLRYAEEQKLNQGADLSGDPPPSVPPPSRKGEERGGGLDDARLEEVARAYHTYNQLLLEKNSLDFGDLIFYALKLFRERPAILAQYQKQFKYILVDEFQDTNLAQYELVKLLAGRRNGSPHPFPPPRGGGAGEGDAFAENQLTVVGDDNQSIYKFRGASISNILKFKQDFPQAKEIVLIDNYRSRQNILDHAYRLIKKNDPNTLESRLGIRKDLKAVRDGAGVVEIMHARTEDEEARRVVERVVALYGGTNDAESIAPHPWPPPAGRGEILSWNDFAILVRANSHAEPFVAALDRAGIPFQFLASSGLYRERVVLDVLAYLRLLDNYHESPAMYRILNLPTSNIAGRDLVNLLHFANRKAWSLFQACRHAAAAGVSPEGAQALARLVGLIEKHAALARSAHVSRVIYAFLNESGYLQWMTDRERAGVIDEAKQLLYLRRFFEEVTAFERRSAERGVRAFLAEIDYLLESGDEGRMQGAFDEGPEAVKILTVHGAKGLEFKCVFLVNLVEQRFPAQSRSEPIALPDALVREILSEGDAHIEEERRLFYVGLTRARDGVFLSFSDQYGTGVRKRKPSRFLEELGVEQFANLQIGKITNFDPHPTPLPPSRTREGEGEIALPKHFSFTQLKAFETCPLQYKFAHVLKIPVYGKPAFSFGKTMHIALQRFYTKMIEMNSAAQESLFSSPSPLTPDPLPRGEGGVPRIPSLDDLLKIYDEAWMDDWYENAAQKEGYRKRGKDMLTAFYEKQTGEGWRQPVALEQGFHLKLESYILKGAIDRMDPLPDGGVEILDYKTGKPKTAEDLAKEDRKQLLIYQIAAEEVIGKAPRILTYYFLKDQSKVSFLGTPEEITELKSEIVETIEKIKTSDFAATPSPFKCGNCDFKDICPFRQL